MPSPAGLLIAGAGGHALVVIDALLCALQAHSMPPPHPLLLIDDDPARSGQNVLGVPVVTATAPEAAASILFHVAIGRNAARERMFATMSTRRIPYSVLHPHASISPSSQLGEGVLVAARAVVGPATQIGEACIINHGAVVDHECILGAFSHVAPNATLAGQVRLGRRVMIGAGANILPGVRIGDDCVIGAGAVVRQDIPAGFTVAGVPARRIQKEQK